MNKKGADGKCLDDDSPDISFDGPPSPDTSSSKYVYPIGNNNNSYDMNNNSNNNNNNNNSDNSNNNITIVTIVTITSII